MSEVEWDGLELCLDSEVEQEVWHLLLFGGRAELIGGHAHIRIRVWKSCICLVEE